MRMFGTAAMLGCALLAGWTSARGEPVAPQEEPAMSATGTGCKYDDNPDTPFLTVAVSQFADKCMAPRGDPSDFVRIPLDASDFTSKCAIKLAHEAAVSSPCSTNDTSKEQPLRKDDLVTVTDWGGGIFTLTRLRGNYVVPLRAAPALASVNGTPYLYGSHHGFSYAVYVQHARVTGGRFEKVYRFEVFDHDSKDPNLCRTHMPTHAAKVVDCDVEKLAPLKPIQTGTSTGGEPPPK